LTGSLVEKPWGREKKPAHGVMTQARGWSPFGGSRGGDIKKESGGVKKRGKRGGGGKGWGDDAAW